MPARGSRSPRRRKIFSKAPCLVTESPFELSLPDLLRERDPLLRWKQAFGVSRILRIEIGVGNSDFLIEVAQMEPNFNYLGFEYSAKRVFKFLRRVDKSTVENIRMVRANVVGVLDDLLAPEGVDRFFIHFPDPWPKNRHTKHRLIQLPTAEKLARFLIPGGGISLRTDSADYAAQMLEVLEAVENLENLAGPGNFSEAPRDAVPTRYELKYRGEGRTIHYLEYRRR